MTSLRSEADRHAIRAVRPSRVVAVAATLAMTAVATAAAQTATEVQVTPETMTLAVGQRQPIFATAYDRQGNLIASAKFTFWSSDTAVARVSREGTVQGVAPGLAKVEARVQGKRASLAVLITGGAAAPTGPSAVGAALTLEPATAMVLPGETVRVTPQALRDDGTAVPVGRVIWKSLKPEVAGVDTSGVVVGVAPGKSIVQATTSTGLMATVPVEVEAAEIALVGGTEVLGPEEAETLRVVVPSQGNRMLAGTMEWSSADTNVAVVGPGGVVTARKPGRTEIGVRAYGQERRTGLLVHRLPETLVVTPKPTAEPLPIPLKATRTFTAVAEAADATPVPEARIAWSVADTSLASFDPTTGTLIARDTGTTTLTARLRGFEPVVWHVQVVPGVLGLDRTRLGLRPGEQVGIAARLTDDAGKVLGPTAVQWRIDHPEVATVSGGEVRAVSPGHATLTATSAWGTTTAAEIYVVADLLVASNRSGAFGLYQLRSESPDTLLPVLVDGEGNVQGVRSPDRTRIAYSSMRSGSYDLYVVDADGRNPRRITVDPGSEGEPVWTPDGARLIYTFTPSGGAPQLVSVRADGTDPQPITSSAGGNRSPDVSPDGRRVAFVSPRYLPNGDLIYIVDKGSKARLMRVPAGGAVPVQVAEIDQPVVALDVSRDGQRLAYIAGKVAEAGKGKSQLTLRVQPLAAAVKPTLVPLRPGEQVSSPSF